MKKWMMILTAVAVLLSTTSCSRLAVGKLEEIGEVGYDGNTIGKGFSGAVEKEEDSEAEDFFVDSDSYPLGGDSIDGTVIYNSGNIKATIAEMGYDAGAPYFDVTVENNSGKNIDFSIDLGSINGMMIYTFGSIDVGSGDRVTDTVSFDSVEMERSKISVVKDMEFQVLIRDEIKSEQLDAKMVKLEFNKDVSYTQTYDDSGTELYNSGGIKIMAQELEREENGIFTEVWFYAENNSNKTIAIMVEEMTVNGYDVEESCYTAMTPGKKACGEIMIDNDELDGYGMTDLDSIHEIEVNMEIMDIENYVVLGTTGSIVLTVD